MLTFEMATIYTALGISVIPLLPRSKQPHFDLLKATGYTRQDGDKVKAAWELAQEKIASMDIIKKWFNRPDEPGIALVGGEVSHKLVYLDFDDPEAYRRWALDHKPMVNSTAVQKTAHGYHVFIRTPDTKTGNMYYKNVKVGQIKGEGGYVVCSPSIHPEGVQYRWLRHPQDGIIIIRSLAELDIYRQMANNKPKEVVSKPFHFTNETKQAQRLLARLASWRADDYEAWLEVGLALSPLGQAGLTLWHSWSAQSNKYDPDVLDKKWLTFAPDGGMTLGSLGYWANQDDPGNQTNKGWQTL